MNIEQERAEFEAWFTKTKAYISDPKHIFAQIVRDIAWKAWQARAALQSQSNHDTTLFCDLETDEEKSAFFLSGRGYETGVIAQAIQNDVAMAYHRCAEYKKELEALQSQNREDAFIDGVLLGLQVIAGSGNSGNADHDELMRSAGVDLVVRRAIKQEMWELAGLDRNQISIEARRRIEDET